MREKHGHWKLVSSTSVYCPNRRRDGGRVTVTLIWLVCVLTTWTPASGMVDGYQAATNVMFSSDYVFDLDVPENTYQLCLDNKYEVVEFAVRGFDGSSVFGPWSDPGVFQLVHDFDFDGSGVVGFPDFGMFVSLFGTSNPLGDADGNGTVGFPDFALFIESFGQEQLPGGSVER